MPRIRTVKPEFFTHEDLFECEARARDLARATHRDDVLGLVRLAYEGLWLHADREGRFRWRLRTLKAGVLPFDECDFEFVLAVLSADGFVVRYEIDDETYGWLPTFTGNQVINNRERASTFPACPDEAIDESRKQACFWLQGGAPTDDEARESFAWSTRAPRDVDASSTRAESDETSFSTASGVHVSTIPPPEKGSETQDESPADLATREARESDASSTRAPRERRGKERKGKEGKGKEGEGKAASQGDGSLSSFVDDWNQFAQEHKLKRWTKITKDRRAKLRVRLADDDWRRLYAEARAKLPLVNVKSTWQPDLDWFIANESNVCKLVEGKYDFLADGATESSSPAPAEKSKRYSAPPVPGKEGDAS